ncbi:MAG: hypothetical protein HQK59_15150 [Deltaproteobacteria bacterium]|nr:hypothetical protein [Deltaproteobacteria bacterium]
MTTFASSKNTYLASFLTDWVTDPQGVRASFISLIEKLAAKAGVSFDFKARPGVSYSLRATCQGFSARPLFAIIDVVDDPEARWLSVCFYEDMVSDPDELGNMIPQGILGEDGHCFDVFEKDDALLAYLDQRISEAHRHAASTT